MKPKPKRVKRTVKLKPFEAFLIKNRDWDLPWTIELSTTEEGAENVFAAKNKMFNFDRAKFEIIRVQITQLPLRHSK